MPARYLLWSSVRPSVRLSQVGIVSKRLNIGFHKQRRTIAQDSSLTAQKISTKFRYDHPQRGRQVQVGAVKIAFFNRSRRLRLRCFTAITLCPSATVVRVHDGVLAEQYAVSSTTLVVVDVDWSQLRSNWQQQGWSFESLLMTCTALYARCAIESIATMHVQNYAGSRTKSDRCWKYSSGWQAICLRYSYNSRAIFQLTKSVARVSRR